MPLQLPTWSLPIRAASLKLSIIKLKKIALISAKLLSHFSGEKLLSHIGGVPYFYPSKPVSAYFFLSRQNWPHFSSSVLFWFSIMCRCHLFPKMRDGWEIKDAGLWISRAENRAGHYNKCAFTSKSNCVQSLWLPRVTKREVSKSSVREIVIKPGLWKIYPM